MPLNTLENTYKEHAIGDWLRQILSHEMDKMSFDEPNSVFSVNYLVKEFDKSIRLKILSDSLCSCSNLICFTLDVAVEEYFTNDCNLGGEIMSNLRKDLKKIKPILENNCCSEYCYQLKKLKE